MSFLYTVPAVVQHDGRTATYRLYLQKQPGTRAIPWKVRIVLPPGARVLSLQVDDKSAEVEGGDQVEVITDLRRDREIMVRFQIESPEDEP